jgi:serine/threonine protein kinase
LRTVLRSQLLSRDGLQTALRGVPRDQREDPQALADHLVRAGKLSRFQARKLLKGAALGLVLGPYQILAPIGRGGMGTVFLARDDRSGQLLALKVLPPKKAKSEGRILARFRREMEMCRLVAHAHLAWTQEVGEYRGVHYIAMEYIPGRTLSRLVASEGPLALPRAARLMAEVASGLEHAHEKGLIHRDLKPGNIQVTPRDHAKVLDLGLALVYGETADTKVVGGVGYIVGSMDFIAPEQTTNAASVDRRSDLYSLGCTLFFALTGQPPFPGGTSREKIKRQRYEEPPSLAERRPELPPAFVDLVSRLMCKDPEGRPATAAEAEKELSAWAAGDPPQPPDAPADQAFDESVVTLQALGTSEDSATSLPAVALVDEDLQEEEPLDEPREVQPFNWVVAALAAALAILFGASLFLIGAWVFRR